MLILRHLIIFTNWFGDVNSPAVLEVLTHNLENVVNVVVSADTCFFPKQVMHSPQGVH